MTNLINDFLSQPLWLSIPLVMIYLALLAYFLYILWHYRRNTLSAVLLTIALFVGQKAAADSDITNGGQHYTLFDSEGYYTATADLNGRPLSGKPTQKGLYIVNGNKVVIK